MRRKYRRELLSRINSLKTSHENLDEDLVKLGGLSEYETTLNYYDGLILKLEEEIESLPIGHRYTGEFFVKVPYSIPPEYMRCNGSIYMKEELVSWEIESGVDSSYQHYHRALFKDDKGREEIKREDAAPVYNTIENTTEKIY